MAATEEAPSETGRTATILEVVDGVATITLNRPDHYNAIDPVLRDELESALEEVRSGTKVRVVRIRGAGRGFCAGYDLTSGSSVYQALGADGDDASGTAAEPGSSPLSEIGQSHAVIDRERIREGIERWLRMARYPKPIIAEVHGACLAGGLDLIGACDIVYAATDSRFGHPAGRGMGIPPTLGMLPMRIGYAATKELLFTGDLVDGTRAAEIGLVEAAFAPNVLQQEVWARCRRMAANSLDALILHKAAVNRWADLMGARVAALEGAEFDALFHVTPSSAEFGRVAAARGLKAALEWRDAGFDGE